MALEKSTSPAFFLRAVCIRFNPNPPQSPLPCLKDIRAGLTIRNSSRSLYSLRTVSRQLKERERGGALTPRPETQFSFNFL